MITPLDILEDSLEIDYESGTVYDKHRHTLIRSDWLETLRRVAMDKGLSFANDLLLYQHVENGAFVLGFWKYRPNTGRGPGLIMELEQFDGHPDHFVSHGGSTNMPSIEYAMDMLKPATETIKQIRVAMVKKHEQKKEYEVEREELRKESAKFWSKRSPEYADRIRRGEVALVGEKEGAAIESGHF